MASVLGTTAPPATLAFLTPAYEVRWSSMRFYAEMTEHIRAIAERHGWRTASVPGLTDDGLPGDALFVVDAASVIALARSGEIEHLLGRKYVYVIGENIDPSRDSLSCTARAT